MSGSLSPGQPQLVLTLRTHFTNRKTVQNARKSNFLSSNCCVPTICGRGRWRRRRQVFLAPVYRTSSPFEDRLRSRILQFLRTLVFFCVLLVGFEEWFYIPAESLPYIRRAISCILFSLEQSRALVLTVAEHHPDSIFRIQCYEFRIISALVATYEVILEGNFCQIAFYAPAQSIQYLTKTFCTCSRCATSQE